MTEKGQVLSGKGMTAGSSGPRSGEIVTGRKMAMKTAGHPAHPVHGQDRITGSRPTKPELAHRIAPTAQMSNQIRTARSVRVKDLFRDQDPARKEAVYRTPIRQRKKKMGRMMTRCPEFRNSRMDPSSETHRWHPVRTRCCIKGNPKAGFPAGSFPPIRQPGKAAPFIRQPGKAALFLRQPGKAKQPAVPH